MLAGLEVVRTLNDLEIVTEAPVELVNWTDEEGSRFGYMLMGSGVWSGLLDRDKMEGLTDLDGITVAEALDATGIRGPDEARAFPADSYFELHIEQGPILEREGKIIGIVTGAQAQIWYDAVVTGQEAHAGTTPPAARKDALVGAACIVDCVDRLMRKRGEDGRGTVGQMTVLPNSRNVIPGEVRFSVEFRHPMPTRSRGSTRSSGARRARSLPARAFIFHSRNCSSCRPNRSTRRASTSSARPRTD